MSFGIKLNKRLSSFVLVFALALSPESFGADWDIDSLLKDLIRLQDQPGAPAAETVHTEAAMEAATAPAESVNTPTEEAETQAILEGERKRLEKNRASARGSRARKKDRINQMIATIQTLEANVSAGETLNDQLHRINFQLREQIQSLRQRELALTQSYQILTSKIFEHFEKFIPEMCRLWHSYGVSYIQNDLFRSGLIPERFHQTILNFVLNPVPESVSEEDSGRKRVRSAATTFHSE